MPLDVSLFDDRRGSVPGAGVHALLIGVSVYDHLPKIGDGGSDPTVSMRGLASPALTAWRFAQWLRDPATRLHRPLKTLRILTSPDEAETQDGAHPSGGGAPQKPTRENIQYALRAWRDNASVTADDIAIFYFGGHGIRADAASAMMLASDFLAQEWTPMDRAFAFSDVRDGMAPSPSRPNIATTQFYFVDCCRNDVPSLTATDDSGRWAFLDRGKGADGRARVALFATVDGAEAVATNGKPTYFGQMLLDALCHGSLGLKVGQPAGQTRWPITSMSLFQTLSRLARERGLKSVHSDSVYAPIVNGIAAPDAVLCWLKDPPCVNLAFELLPADLRDDAILEVVPGDGAPVSADVTREAQVNASGQHQLRLPTGKYEIRVRSASNAIPELTFGEVVLDQTTPFPYPLDLGQAREVSV